MPTGGSFQRFDKGRRAGTGKPRCRLFYRRELRLLNAAVDARELRRDAATERLDGDNGDDGDQGEKQAVLDHAGTTLAVGIELGLDPGPENEEVHGLSSGCC